MPSHKDSTPVSPNDISNAVFAELKVLSIIAGKTSTSPMMTSLSRAMTNERRKNAMKI